MKFVPPRYRGAIFCHLCFYESELGFHASWTTCLYLSLLQSAMCLESFSVTDKIVRRAIQRLLNPLMQAFDEEGFRLLPTLRHESLHYPIHVNERAAASSVVICRLLNLPLNKLCGVNKSLRHAPDNTCWEKMPNSLV